jgi:O-antigen/teichoic acid export membrane protein
MEHGISPALNVQAILRKSPQSPPMIPRKTAVFAAILNTNSVRTRFIVSVLSNTSRAALGFASGVLVARALAPSNYGELTFLLGSFVALLALLDMGTSATFYTLISQRPRPRQFYIVYFVWQGLQFLVAAIFLAWLCPDSFLNTIWL